MSVSVSVCVCVCVCVCMHALGIALLYLCSAFVTEFLCQIL